MFVVPEVEDDAELSTPTEPPKTTLEIESKKEDLTTSVIITSETEAVPPLVSPLVSQSSLHSSSSVTKNEPIPIKTSPLPATVPTKQHRSRHSLFHRNTIHICDQIVDRITSHQQHHSAPPSHNLQGKTGLQSINENAEYSSSNDTQQQQQQHHQQRSTVNPRFPRSSTVPYPAYATVRIADPQRYPPQFYSHEYPSFAQVNPYVTSRQPLTLINNQNFQPISPNHQQYSSRPVDILKPTFLIVPKEAEQQLSTQLSASTSPVPPVIHSNKVMPKKTDKGKTKQQDKTTTSPTVRSVEVQTNDDSPTRRVTTNLSSQHVGLLATPNPSPYVHFVNVPYLSESPQYFFDGPPETSIIQDEFLLVNEYHPATSSIRSMPNIALAQGTPPQNDEQQPVSPPPPPPAITTTTTTATTAKMRETDESSDASIDFAHGDLVDVPGSWRYRSMPVSSATRRYRPPIPSVFFDQQAYASDSEQVVRSASFRQPQQQLLAQSRTFGSIPTISRPFDSMRSQQTVGMFPSVRLNEKDVVKISSFYQSIGTLVYVARSIATLYTSDFDAMANLRDWKKLYTGVPIWLFNTGMNPKRNRCIRLIISELGSSFILWDTVVNGASDVRLPKARHITLKSLETGTILALKFDDTNATDEFHQYFVKLSSDVRNSDLFDIFNAKRRRPQFVLRKRKIKKSAISKPTEFNHITKVDEHDRDSLYTYSVLVDDGALVG